MFILKFQLESSVWNCQFESKLTRLMAVGLVWVGIRMVKCHYLFWSMIDCSKSIYIKQSLIFHNIFQYVQSTNATIIHISGDEPKLIILHPCGPKVETNFKYTCDLFLNAPLLKTSPFGQRCVWIGHIGTYWDILGHFGTSWDILDICGLVGRLLDELGALRPFT